MGLSGFLLGHQGRVEWGEGRFGWEAWRGWKETWGSAVTGGWRRGRWQPQLSIPKSYNMSSLSFPPPNPKMHWPFYFNHCNNLAKMLRSLCLLVYTQCNNNLYQQPTKFRHSFSSFDFQPLGMSAIQSVLMKDSLINKTGVLFCVWQKQDISEAVTENLFLRLSESKALILQGWQTLPFCSQTCRLCVGHRALSASL